MNNNENNTNSKIPDDIEYFKDFDLKTYRNIYNLVKDGKLKKYNTDKGIGFSKSEFIELQKTLKKGRPIKNAYRIDLSVPSKINCLYRHLAEMNKSNKECCQKNNKLQRYLDENGKVYINIKDYIYPQIKLIAKKLECKQSLVASKISDLIQELYKKEI